MESPDWLYLHRAVDKVCQELKDFATLSAAGIALPVKVPFILEACFLFACCLLII
ncbi:hypothetical protein B4168_2722 [Anoxybacillus flavithermus]|nr:hypothetical protein B4168_2722 [Anoxybacillus flavithermus]OAO87488.1 hypothetical protein GT23_1137 [Parageobacillus thermoglucosidasius]